MQSATNPTSPLHITSRMPTNVEDEIEALLVGTKNDNVKTRTVSSKKRVTEDATSLANELMSLDNPVGRLPERGQANIHVEPSNKSQKEALKNVYALSDSMQTIRVNWPCQMPFYHIMVSRW